MKKVLVISLVSLYFITTYGQNPSIILEINSGDKGVILARTVSSSVLNPTDGLLIYDTIAHAFKYYDGTTSSVSMLAE